MIFGKATVYRLGETSSREIPRKQIKRLMFVNDFAKFGARASLPSPIELDQRLDRGRGFGRSIGRKCPRQEPERIVLEIVGMAFGGTLVASNIAGEERMEGDRFVSRLIAVFDAVIEI